MVDLGQHENPQTAAAHTRDPMGQWLKSAAPTGRGRRRGADQEALVTRVVERYRELVSAGHRNPRQVIAAEENYTPEHIGRLLVRARREGLLAPAKPGRAGELAETDAPDPTDSGGASDQ